jgi:peptidoglycan/xylan/chitin deacetylase (PgdA/CDA1 family)
MQLAPLYPLLYRALKPAFPTCLWSGPTIGPSIRPTLGPAAGLHPSANLRPQVALTFDDGPHPRHTLELLEVLAQYAIRASFFWLGIGVERFPAVAQAVVAQGHWIGLHGYDHKMFPQMSASELQGQLARTRSAISQTCQIPVTRLIDVRPPNGVATPQTIRRLTSWGYRSVMWSVVPEDWLRPGVAVASGRILRQAQPGSLIVLHDGAAGGEDVAATAALVIPQLLARDWQYVTVDDFWKQRMAQS